MVLFQKNIKKNKNMRVLNDRITDEETLETEVRGYTSEVKILFTLR